MNHLVLVSLHYPPSNAAGARRPHNLARRFRAAGWQVSVVTTGEPPTPWTTGDAGERILRVPVPAQFSRVAAAATTSVPPRTAGAPGPLARIRGRLRRQVIAYRSFPDLWRDAEAALVDGIREAIGDGAATVLYSTAPPITAHQAAATIRAERPEIPWVAEHRDPWIEPGTSKVRWAGTYLASRGRRLLRGLLAEADLHVAVSQGISGWLRGQGAGRTEVALNGIPDTILDSPQVEHESACLRYVGELYLGRDPRPLFDSLGRLASRGALADDFRLELIGDVESSPGGATRELIRERGLERWTTLRGRVPHAEAVAAIAGAGALILLASGQPTQIPNKLYEYLGSGRPILAVVDAGGESHRLLQEAGMSDLVLTPSSDEEQWDRALMTAIAESRAPSRPSGSLATLRSSRQLDQVVAWCRDLLHA